MPYATISRDEIIDHVVPVDEIGPLLTKITNDMVAAHVTADSPPSQLPAGLMALEHGSTDPVPAHSGDRP